MTGGIWRLRLTKSTNLGIWEVSIARYHSKTPVSRNDIGVATTQWPEYKCLLSHADWRFSHAWPASDKRFSLPPLSPVGSHVEFYGYFCLDIYKSLRAWRMYLLTVSAYQSLYRPRGPKSWHSGGGTVEMGAGWGRHFSLMDRGRATDSTVW